LGARPLTVVRRSASELSNGSSNSASGGADGGLSSPSTKPRRAMRRCHKCNDNYKPPRAHHDSVTGRCVVKFDHFCPWVGNAVGAMNHKFFCLFLLYTAVTCTLSLLLLGVRAVHCGYMIDVEEGEKDAFDNNNNARGGTYGGGGGGEGTDRGLGGVESIYRYPGCSNFYSSHAVLGLFLSSLIFLVFTCSMGCEQMEAVETGKGKIARMKMRVGDAGTEFRTVTEEFNEMFGGQSPEMALHWFLPFNVEFPRGMKKVVLGYDWDESFDPEAFEPPTTRAAINPSPSDPLGDHEMQQMEGGEMIQARTPPSAVVGAAAAPIKDVLLSRESEMSLTEISVHSESSVASGIKNRKSPPPKTID